MEPDDLLCSRNARPQKALVGRAQWEINQVPSLKRSRASLEGDLYCSRRVKDNLGTFLNAMWRRLEGVEGSPGTLSLDKLSGRPIQASCGAGG
jgi:hypothetical protein